MATVNTLKEPSLAQIPEPELVQLLWPNRFGENGLLGFTAFRTGATLPRSAA